jgi:MFS family permease
MDGTNHTATTYRYERIRAISAGMLETAGSTFLLLIAVSWFQAGIVSKALVAAGGSIGLMLTPLTVSWVAAFGCKASVAAAGFSLFGALAFFIMAIWPQEAVFVGGSIVAMTCASAMIPLVTQIYQENYPENARGRLFSRTIMIRIATAAVFSELAGRLLGGNIERFRLLLLMFGAAFLLSSYCLAKCPSRPLAFAGGGHPLRSWRCVRQDRLFCYTLICWMLMGFANLMMYPLRVEYLANPKYGIALAVGLVAYYNGVVPNIARLLVSPVWGWLFDRMNFFVLRVVLNIGFALGILTFFMSTSKTGLLVGAIIFGISNAGGDVAWSLWVTKFAKPDKVADYMAVHTFFTGVRGVLAPLVAFHALAYISFTALGWISAAMIFAASLMLIPEIRSGVAVRSAPVIVEEVSE